jgi:hypothetical protein
MHNRNFIYFVENIKYLGLKMQGAFSLLQSKVELQYVTLKR